MTFSRLLQYQLEFACVRVFCVQFITLNRVYFRHWIGKSQQSTRIDWFNVKNERLPKSIVDNTVFIVCTHAKNKRTAYVLTATVHSLFALRNDTICEDSLVQVPHCEIYFCDMTPLQHIIHRGKIKSVRKIDEYLKIIWHNMKRNVDEYNFVRKQYNVSAEMLAKLCWKYTVAGISLYRWQNNETSLLDNYCCKRTRTINANQMCVRILKESWICTANGMQIRKLPEICFAPRKPWTFRTNNHTFHVVFTWMIKDMSFHSDYQSQSILYHLTFWTCAIFIYISREVNSMRIHRISKWEGKKTTKAHT